MNSIGVYTILMSIAVFLSNSSAPPHEFELVPAENAVELGEGTFQVGWIKAFLPDDISQVQMIPVEMNTPYTYWPQWGLDKQDVNFDGYLDIAAREHGGATWGRLHWFLYDPKSQRFYTSALSKTLSNISCASLHCDPVTKRITMRRFFGTALKEYVFRVADGELLFCGSRWELASTEEENQRSFPTTPDRQQRPRTYHTPITDIEYDDKIWISHYDLIDTGEKTLSPNGAYWFALKTEVIKDEGANTWLWVQNERDYLLGIEIVGTDRRYQGRANWINEKLVYFQWWWGKVLGGYLLLDVESEQIIQKEFVHDGQAAFQ